ncbi:MAG TPA: hypothetical protein VI039_07815 [Solirubrobacterales bacterium]
MSVVFAGVVAAPASALSPAVETLPASSVTETGATLNGKVNPNGAETKIYFEYGTTTSYGSKTSEVSVGSGTTVLEKSQAIGSLNPGTVYHYRIVASNSAGTSQGVDKTFSTVGPPPEVWPWLAEIEPGGEAAILWGWVNPNGQETTYQFEYGTASESYTTTVPVPAASAGSSSEGAFVTQKITGLNAKTKYYFRLAANNAGGKAYSEEFYFPYEGTLPTVEASPASNVAPTKATLKGTVNAGVLGANYYFEYGTTTSYGSKTPVKNTAESSTANEVLTGLSPNTVYHYRLVAGGWEGGAASKDQTFTTLAPVTMYQGGSPLSSGAEVKVFSSSFLLPSGYCNETELSGKWKENPGVLQSVSKTKAQNAGGNCPWVGNTVKWTIPVEGISLEYGVNGAEQGSVSVSEFTLKGVVYFGATPNATCEYSVAMGGSFTPKTTLLLALKGVAKLTYFSGFCPEESYVEGSFAVTNGGKAVEAKP